MITPCLSGGGGGELKRVVIGSSTSQSARSFNVKSVLPDVYDKLTLDNFGAVITYMYYGSGTPSLARGNLFSGYNASTGVLSTAVECLNSNYLQFTVVCWYVE